MFYLAILPVFVVAEGLYLLRHPRTFSGLAAFLWALITGISGLLLVDGRAPALVPVVQVAAIGVYYFVKVWR